MRLSPPVGGTLWRELPANDNEPLTIQGHLIPKGTQVGVSIYSIHHNPKYFPDPFKFRPERWLQGDQSSTHEGVPLKTEAMHNAFAPFSSGPRGCAGKAMAYTEASLVVSKLLMRFDFEASSGKYKGIGGGTGVPGDLRGRREEFQMYDHFSSSHDGPHLVLRPRKA
jgi:cytochrome P450